jgi:predicted metal-dependent enzyme (double-stranded beta helix superfamily)
MSPQEDTANELKKLVFLPAKKPSNRKEALSTLPGLHKLVQEYYNLATSKELSETDAERLSEIFELAQYDELLDEWIGKVDEAIEIVEPLKPKQLSIEEFISEMERIPSQEMTLERFKELAEQLYLSERFLNKHIHFKDDSYHRQLIFQTSFGCVYVIAWKPGQSTTIHLHCNDLSVIRVCQGILTHRFFKEAKFTPGGYRRLHKKQFEENQWVCVDSSQIHQFANEFNKNLVTLHFRFFSQPIEIDVSASERMPAEAERMLVNQPRCIV